VSTTTAIGLVVLAVSVAGLVIVGGMLWWAAREDGRDQKRTDALLARRRRSR
jgi:hypothetical protein